MFGAETDIETAFKRVVGEATDLLFLLSLFLMERGRPGWAAGSTYRGRPNGLSPEVVGKQILLVFVVSNFFYNLNNTSFRKWINGTIKLTHIYVIAIDTK